MQLNFIVLQILREVSSINKKVGAIEEFSSSVKERLNDIEKFLSSSDLYPGRNFTMPQTLIYDQRNAPLLETSLYESTQQQSASFMENTPLYEPPSNPWDTSPSGSQWNYSPVRQCIPQYSYGSSTPRRVELTNVPVRPQYAAQTFPVARPVHLTTEEHKEKDIPTSSSTTKTRFSAKYLTDIKKASTSRYNFAVNLVRECFSDHLVICQLTFNLKIFIKVNLVSYQKSVDTEPINCVGV